MLSSIVRTLPRQLNLAAQARTFFTPAYFNIEQFKNYAAEVEKTQGKNSSQLKLTIEEAIAKPEGKIFTEDLKTILYLSKTDADLDLLISAIRKYNKQESTAIFSFNFEAPLIRLLYTLNKTDRALALLMEDKNSIMTKFSTPAVMLMNKLLEEKRYADVVKVYERLITKFKEIKKAQPNVIFRINLDLSNLITEALLGLNTADALATGKKVIQDFQELKEPVHDNAYIKLFLLAHNQNQFDMAMELLRGVKNKKPNIINNLRILTLLRVNRVDEAITLAEETNKIVLRGFENQPLFFKETLAMLTDLSGKVEGEKKDRLNDLVTTIKQEEKLIDMSLNDYALKLNEIKKDQQRRQGQDLQRPRDDRGPRRDQLQRDGQQRQQFQRRDGGNQPRQQREGGDFQQRRPPRDQQQQNRNYNRQQNREDRQPRNDRRQANEQEN